MKANTKSKPALDRGSKLPSGAEVVLLAVTGMSPAILTETVWALAHPKNTGGSPIIAKQIVVVTTTSGKRQIEEELLRSPSAFGAMSVWDALRKSIIGHRKDIAAHLMITDIRVITAPNPKSGVAEPLLDIRSPEDNDAAGDFIMDEVRRIVGNPDTRLIASLAGGRKTMGALLYAVLSLLGRAQDSLTHVLVNEPFESPALMPRFYFPGMQASEHLLKDRSGNVVSKHKSSEARLVLANVPFVRLSKLFPAQIGKFPGRFTALVEAYSQKIDQIVEFPKVSLTLDFPGLIINGVRVKVSGREAALYAFLLHRLQSNAPTSIMQKDCLDELKAWLPGWANSFAEQSFQRRAAAEWKNPFEEDLRKQLASLRGKFKLAGLTNCLPNLLPARGHFGIQVRAAAS